MVTSTRPPQGFDENRYYLLLSAFNQGYWVLGCTLGALLGNGIAFDTTGMDFALTALFVVLVLEQWKKIGEPFPFVLAVFSGIASLILWHEHMLLASIALSIAVLLVRGGLVVAQQ